MAVTDGSGSEPVSHSSVNAPGLVVITGADGFAGRAACAHLRASGVPFRGFVRALSMTTAARPDIYAVGDLTATADAGFANALSAAHTVVHLAGRAHRMDDVADPLPEFRAVNVGATERLARAAAAAGAAHFVFASSVKVNGESTPPGQELRESDPPDPRDDYAASKWEAECALADIARETGMPVTVLRLPLMYGPGAKGNVARLADTIARGIPLPLSRIDNRRSLLGLRNFVSALDAAIVGPLPPLRTVATYFVADALPVSTPDLVRAMAAALGVNAHLFPVPLPLLRIASACLGKTAAFERLAGSLVVDAAAFGGAFGWRPPRTMADELADMVRARHDSPL